MDDVAERASVSQMTVSRVMRNAANVSQSVRDRVLEAAREIGYIPNRIAGNLAGNDELLVAVLLPNLRDHVFGDVLRGIYEGLAAANTHPVFGVSDYVSQGDEHLLRSLLAWRPRGLILPGQPHTDATRRLLSSSGARVVEIMEVELDPVAAAVGFSNAKVGADMARHFLQRGYRKMAFVGADGARGDGAGNPFAIKRRLGFVDTVRAAGAQVVETIIANEPPSMKEGRRMTAELIERRPEIDAIYFATDDLALGGYMHCLVNNVPTPDRVGLAGFGDHPLLIELPQKLTTTRAPRFDVGFTAARLVVCDETAAAHGPIIDLGYELVKGDTT